MGKKMKKRKKKKIKNFPQKRGGPNPLKFYGGGGKGG